MLRRTLAFRSEGPCPRYTLLASKHTSLINSLTVTVMVAALLRIGSRDYEVAMLGNG
jgi:hypothetical protein